MGIHISPRNLNNCLYVMFTEVFIKISLSPWLDKFNRCDKSMRNMVVLEHETYISHVIRGLMR